MPKITIKRAQIAVIVLAIGAVLQNPNDVHVWISSLGGVIAAFTGPAGG